MGLLEETPTRDAPATYAQPLAAGGRGRDGDFFQHVAAMMAWREHPNPRIGSDMVRIPPATKKVGMSSACSVTFADETLVIGLDRGSILAIDARGTWEWEAHAAPVIDVAHCGNDGRVVSWGADGTLRLWSREGSLLEELGTFRNRSASAASGTQVAVASDKMLTFVPGGETLHLPVAVRALVGSTRPGEWFAALHDGAVAWVRDGEVRMLEATGRGWSSPDLRRSPAAVAVSTDRLAVGGGKAFGGGLVDIWSLGPEPKLEHTFMEWFEVTALAFDPTGRYLAIGDESCHLCLRRVPDFTVLKRAQHHVECRVTHAAWSASGDRLTFACRHNRWSERIQASESSEQLLAVLLCGSHVPQPGLCVWTMPKE